MINTLYSCNKGKGRKMNLKKPLPMADTEPFLTTEQYVSAIEYEYAGMINALNYLCQEADAATLEYVSLHLNIAIEELKEYHLPSP